MEVNILKRKLLIGAVLEWNALKTQDWIFTDEFETGRAA